MRAFLSNDNYGVDNITTIKLLLYSLPGADLAFCSLISIFNSHNPGTAFVEHSLTWKMNFIFHNDLRDPVNLQPILISGPDSLEFSNKEYIFLYQNGNAEYLFEIRYEYHCSPFKQAMSVDNIIAVGFEEYFYLFDLFTKSNTLRLKMEGYFGHLYFNEDLFYVADSAGIFCINKNASITWQNKNLGIDGIIINDFTNDKVSGSGEWDPAGGWRDFILDKQTGSLIK